MSIIQPFLSFKIMTILVVKLIRKINAKDSNLHTCEPIRGGDPTTTPFDSNPLDILSPNRENPEVFVTSAFISQGRVLFSFCLPESPCTEYNHINEN